jgi:hypothetical protein
MILVRQVRLPSGPSCWSVPVGGTQPTGIRLRPDTCALTEAGGDARPAYATQRISVRHQRAYVGAVSHGQKELEAHAVSERRSAMRQAKIAPFIARPSWGPKRTSSADRLLEFSRSGCYSPCPVAMSSADSEGTGLLTRAVGEPMLAHV